MASYPLRYSDFTHAGRKDTVARAFRADEALKRTFLVALSGYALPEDLQHTAEAGFERHLAKPLGLQALQDLLSSLPDSDW
jgi:CheY-like chemotaxis protein